jgi:cyclopropane fatty-acyl-phospholipid synthase-like methyltransferase
LFKARRFACRHRCETPVTRVVLLSLLALVSGLGLFVAIVGTTTLKRWAYEEPGRDAWQQPDRVVAALALRAGSTVGDVGSGGGYFSFRFAGAVGREGRVYSADLDEGLLAYVAEQAGRRGLDNLRTVQARPDDPALPEPVDLLFLSNTAHHFSDRVAWFRNARRYLAPGARVAIVDYVGKHGAPPVEELVAELEQAGYRLVEQFDFLDRQYFVVFEPVGRLAEPV